MNSITIEEAVSMLGWVLLHFVWQGLVVGAVAGLLLRILRRASPRWRYAVCALGLCICLCIPLIHLTWSLVQIGELSSSQTVELPAWRQALQTRMPALVVAWFFGVGLMILRLTLGLIWVNQLSRHTIFAPVVWQDRLDALTLRIGLRCRVPLKLHTALSSPVTLGFWRPIVILPAALLSGMPVALVEALLAHELAHVRRWDYLVNLLQRLIETLLFFHPVVWWLSARMRTEREQVADELAAEVLNDPSHLALALHELSLHPHLPQPGLILSGRGGFLLKRIERLLAPPSATASWKLALPALLVACVSLSIQSPAQHPTYHASATSLLQLPVNAKHVLILDEDSGKILMAKDANTVVPIASLTKLMTAMVLLDAKLNPNEKLRVASEDLGSDAQDSALLTTGAQVPRATALRMALMSSENRAAAMLARTYPGGADAFAQAMQAKIHSLGLTHTTITGPTGAAPSNTSTATELAMVVAAAARYPEIAEFTSNKQTKIAVNDLIYELHNTNPLVGDKGWNIRLSKTGNSLAAGLCLTMRMRSHNKNITVVLLHAENPEQRSLDAGKIRDFLDNAS